MYNQIKAYEPWNAQEIQDQKVMLEFLEKHSDAFERTNKIGHMTASAWVIDPSGSKVLMCYHKIYDSWAWLGGHADGEKDLAAVALKEAKEESGLKNVVLVDGEILSLEILTVDGHVKNGIYQPSHLHFNVTYLLQAKDWEPLHIKEDENSDVAWFTFEDALEASTEPWFVEHIYKKIIDKMKRGKR